MLSSCSQAPDDVGVRLPLLLGRFGWIGALTAGHHGFSVLDDFRVGFLLVFVQKRGYFGVGLVVDLVDLGRAGLACFRCVGWRGLALGVSAQSLDLSGLLVEEGLDAGLLFRRQGEPFGQRFIATISQDGNTISGRWEKSEDGDTFTTDFELVYRRNLE